MEATEFDGANDDSKNLRDFNYRSHKGPYSASFDMDAFRNLNSDVPPETHFLIDRHVAIYMLIRSQTYYVRILSS